MRSAQDVLDAHGGRIFLQLALRYVDYGQRYHVLPELGDLKQTGFVVSAAARSRRHRDLPQEHRARRSLHDRLDESLDRTSD